MRIRVTTRADLFEKRKQQHSSAATELKRSGRFLWTVSPRSSPWARYLIRTELATSSQRRSMDTTVR